MSCTHPHEKITITKEGFLCNSCKEVFTEWDLIKDNYDKEEL